MLVPILSFWFWPQNVVGTQIHKQIKGTEAKVIVQSHTRPKGWVPSSKWLLLINIQLKISTKLKLQNFDQTPASKPRPDSSLKVLTQVHLQNLLHLHFDQNLGSEPLPCFSFKISIKLSTRSSALTSATLTTSNSFDLSSSKARVTSVKSTKTAVCWGVS